MFVRNTGKVYRIKDGVRVEAAISYTSRNKKYCVTTYWKDGKQKTDMHRFKAFIPNPKTNRRNQTEPRNNEASN